MFTLKNWLKSDTRFTNLYFFSDGGLRFDPPAASSAVVVKDEGGQIVDWFTQVLPPLTSMEAEYHGLLAALELARRWRPVRAYFHLDNQAVVGQAIGRYRVREPKLKPLHAKVQEAISRLHKSGCSEIEIYHIPREFNLLADALAADALLILPTNEGTKTNFINKGGVKTNEKTN